MLAAVLTLAVLSAGDDRPTLDLSLDRPVAHVGLDAAAATIRLDEARPATKTVKATTRAVRTPASAPAPAPTSTPASSILDSPLPPLMPLPHQVAEARAAVATAAPPPAAWQMADASGVTWTHADPSYLARWVAARNAAMLAARPVVVMPAPVTVTVPRARFRLFGR